MNNIFDYINKRQFAWAGVFGKVLEPFNSIDSLYTNILDNNLYLPLSEKSLIEFSRGSGNELKRNMKALYSSSAFTVNIFEYWKQNLEIANNDIFPLINTLNDLLQLNTQQIVDISYEKQNKIFPTSSKHTHLDVNFECTLYQNVSKANYANDMLYLNYNMVRYL